jgi:hypothetical protein
MREKPAKNRKLCLLIILMVSFFLGGSFSYPALADFNLKDWKYYKEISFSKATSQVKGYGKVRLDGEVFNGSWPGLEDLRVIEGREREVPYKILVSREEEKRVSLSPEIFNLSNSPSSTLFYLDLGEKKDLSNELSIEVAEKNFKREVMIEGSDDLKNWLVLKKGAYIVDFTSHDFTARNTRFSFNESAYRYLRVTIFNYGEKPLTVTGAQVSRLLKKEAQRVELSSRLKARKENPRLKATEIYLDLGYKNLPADLIKVFTFDSNFYRQVEVSGSNSFPFPKWTPLGKDYLFAYSTRQFKAEKREISFSEGQYRYLKLTIFNFDDQPLRITGVRVLGRPRELVFEFDKNKSYFLYYGSRETRKPLYDLEALFPYLEKENFISLSLGPQRLNPAFKEKVVLKPWTERYSAVLWVVLIGTSLTLIFLILNLMRKSG